MPPVHDYVIDNSTGANVRADINSVLQAILSNNSSSSAPSTTAAYMWWADTTNGVLKIRNSANNAWVELLQLDGTLTLEDGSASSPALANRGDLDTGVFFSASNTFNIATGGVERMELGAATVFNEDGADVDFRIEGDTEANLFYVDAGNGRIGIRTNTPSYPLHVNSGAANSVAIFESTDTGVEIEIKDSTGTSFVECQNDFRLKNSSGEMVRIDSSGRLLLGTTTAGEATADDFTVATSGHTGISIRSGTSSEGNIFFADGTSGDAQYRGMVRYFHNNDALAFNAAGSERMRIDSSGNVGIGTTSPSTKLDILRSTDNATTCLITNNGTTGGNCLKLSSGGTGAGTSIFSVFNNNQSSETEVFKIDGSGNVGIGTNDPAGESINGSQNLVIMDTSSDGGMNIKTGTSGLAQIHFSDTSGNGQGRLVYAHSDDSMRLFSAGSERMRIDSSGRLLVGTTTNTIGSSGATVVTNFAGNADNGIKTRDSASHSSVNHMVMISGSTDIGQIVGTTSSVSYNSASDYRLKENVVAISDGISRLKSLKPSRFNFKVTPDETVDGFLAHEVMSIVPQAVSGTKDAVDSNGKPIHQSMDSAKLVPLLVAAVQELITKVETLEAA